MVSSWALSIYFFFLLKKCRRTFNRSSFNHFSHFTRSYLGHVGRMNLVFHSSALPRSARSSFDFDRKESQQHYEIFISSASERERDYRCELNSQYKCNVFSSARVTHTTHDTQQFTGIIIYSASAATAAMHI